MDQLRECIAILRRLAKEPDDPDCVVLAEQAINDYLRKEIEALRAALAFPFVATGICLLAGFFCAFAILFRAWHNA
jgi:hypothetical protein